MSYSYEANAFYQAQRRRLLKKEKLQPVPKKPTEDISLADLEELRRLLEMEDGVKNDPT